MTAQQLKNSILQMAVQGKLVPQDPSDEPASVLLKKIKAEKEALIKSGKLKRDKHESVITRDEDGHYLEKKDGKTTDITDEIPFDLPKGWIWCRLHEICSENNVGIVIRPTRYYTTSDKGIPAFRNANIKPNKIDETSWIYLSPRGIQENPRCVVHENDLLISRSGNAGICCVATPKYDGYGAVDILLISLFPICSPSFISYCINSPFCQQEISLNNRGIALSHIGTNTVAKILFPLPPLEEQKRIVAKIEELLPHVEEYGKAETELSKLNTELPEQLKKSILQWAIQGRLVPQDPTDEPASELLKRIHAEKAALIKSGKLKKEKTLPPISEDEIPFDIPASWEWVRLGTVLLPTQNKKPSGEHFDYIDIDAVDNVANRIREPKHIPVAQASSRAIREIAPGDVLFSLVRPYLKNIALVEKIHADCIASSGFYVCRPSCGIDRAFLFHLMVSDYVVSGINSSIKGFNSPSVRPDNITDFLVPLPPLAEQKLIVERLENLFVHLNCSLIHDKGTIAHGTE